MFPLGSWNNNTTSRSAVLLVGDVLVGGSDSVMDGSRVKLSTAPVFVLDRITV